MGTVGVASPQAGKRRTTPITALFWVTTAVALTGMLLSIHTNRKLAKEIARLRAEMVRYGQPVEIHNPK